MNPVVELKNISKKFGNFTANDGISFQLQKGEVHALLGENGAGKSTLMNILYGILQPTSGEIFINGNKVNISNPNIAIAHGIGMVHQHFMLVEPFTVAENITLGKEVSKFGVFLNQGEAVERVRDLSQRYGLEIDPEARIQDISVGMQQRVEILKTLYRGAEIIILDEPTAVLTPQEIKELAKIIRNLTTEGKSIIIITHKLKEILQMADTCTIIRRGKYIDTVKVADSNEQLLASKMVGRDVSLKVDRKEMSSGDVLFSIEKLQVKNARKMLAVKDLSLSVHAGEILGVAGIDGNGQSELIEAITGLRKVESGRVLIHNKEITNYSPREVFKNKIATIPEDRQKRGLVLDFPIFENLILQTYNDSSFARMGQLLMSNIKEFARELIHKFDIRPPNELLRARDLSGGNQQKIIIAREITHDPDLLIAVQPTRGLDVGAIEFVHKALVEQRNQGKGVLLVSLELDEILNLSDRIVVIYEGRVVATLNIKEANEQKIGLLMAGGADAHEL